MTIAVGSKVPSAPLKKVTESGTEDIDAAKFFEGKRAIVFSLPGAFTPTCSNKHLPGYVAKEAEFKAKGFDIIACLSVNDAHVMKAWAEAHGALGKIVMLADGNAAFSKALGIDIDLAVAGMGIRCARGVFEVREGAIVRIEMEAPGQFEVSSAEACLLKV